jgi:membrane fusion protein (multidrug efflux system)
MEIEKRILWWSISCLGALGLLVSAGCERKPATVAAKPPPPLVEIAEVKQEAIPIFMDFSGTVQAIRTVDIIPRVSGYIEKRYFTEGTHVEQGAPLYLIDPRPFQARLADDKAALKRTQASVVFWTEEAARYDRLAKAGAGSVEKLQEAIQKRDQARAEIEQDKAKITNAELDLSFTNITAPFRGRIQNTRIHVGQLVTAQKDVLTTLVQLDPIYVVFNVSRRQVYDVQQLNLQGLVKALPDKGFKTQVFMSNGKVYEHEGEVDFWSAQIDPSTDTLTGRAIFPNPYKRDIDVHLIPGQYAPLRLILGEQPDAILIPEAALVQTQVGSHVFVVSEDNKVEQRSVEVSHSYDQQWVIKKGLKKGERVIVEGVQKVRPGITVRPEPWQQGKAEA